MEVFHALDVRERAPCAGLLIGDEAAGNAGDRALDGNTGVHQCQRGAADGGLRRRAVGGQDLGDDTDGIRELLNARDHRQQGLLGEGAMADLAAGGGAACSGLAGGERREVVVVDIALRLFRIDGVELLRGGQCVERADGQDLRLASGEQAGAVDARQNADLGVERADLVHLAAVDALALEQPLLDDLLLHLVQAHVDLDIPVFCILLAELLLEVDLLLHLIQADLDVDVEVLILFGELVGEIAAGRGQALLADVLVVGVEGIFDLVHAIGAQIVEQVVVDGCLFKRELRLANGLDDGVDELHDLHVRLMGDADALEHGALRGFLRLGLDHDDFLER